MTDKTIGQHSQIVAQENLFRASIQFFKSISVVSYSSENTLKPDDPLSTEFLHVKVVANDNKGKLIRLKNENGDCLYEDLNSIISKGAFPFLLKDGESFKLYLISKDAITESAEEFDWLSELELNSINPQLIFADSWPPRIFDVERCNIPSDSDADLENYNEYLNFVAQLKRTDIELRKAAAVFSKKMKTLNNEIAQLSEIVGEIGHNS